MSLFPLFSLFNGQLTGDQLISRSRDHHIWIHRPQIWSSTKFHGHWIIFNFFYCFLLFSLFDGQLTGDQLVSRSRDHHFRISRPQKWSSTKFRGHWTIFNFFHFSLLFSLFYCLSRAKIALERLGLPWIHPRSFRVSQNELKRFCPSIWVYPSFAPQFLAQMPPFTTTVSLEI